MSPGGGDRRSDGLEIVIKRDGTSISAMFLIEALG